MPVAVGVQALEQSVGHPLFDRQSKLPTLTLHGQKLLPGPRREADSDRHRRVSPSFAAGEGALSD